MKWTGHFTSIYTLDEITLKKNEAGFYYFILPCGESNRHQDIRIWVNRRLVRVEECEDFGGQKEEIYKIDTTKPSKIIQTEKGNLVLRPCDASEAEKYYIVHVRCGYRGAAWADFEGADVIAKNAEYHSPAGSCGVSKWYLIRPSRNRVIIRAGRDGRTYGGPKEENIVIVVDEDKVIHLEELSPEEAELLE